MKNILLVGAGGHSLACISLIEKLNKFKIIGLIDKDLMGELLGYKIIGKDQDLKILRKKCNNAFVSIGQINVSDIRANVYEKLKRLNYTLPNLISNSAIISKYFSYKDGNIIMDNVTIGVNVEIGYNCIINTGSIIEHGVFVGNNCHIATNVTLNGEVIVGDGSFIGSGTIIKNGVRVGNKCFIKMGSKIISDVPNETKI